MDSLPSKTEPFTRRSRVKDRLGAPRYLKCDLERHLEQPFVGASALPLTDVSPGAETGPIILASFELPSAFIRPLDAEIRGARVIVGSEVQTPYEVSPVRIGKSDIEPRWKSIAGFEIQEAIGGLNLVGRVGKQDVAVNIRLRCQDRP